jgi:hypothetical protein
MKSVFRLLAVSTFALGLVFASAQTGGAVAPGEAKFRVVKSISGSKGEDQAGRFVILDPRTIFYIPDDRKVIAYFEWDGPLGPHHFEGVWKNPDGKISIVSDFTYEAKQKRFAGYWELLLSETMQTGLWTVDARIDGESAGSHTFQIISAAKPFIAESTRKILSIADLYKKSTAATVRIENLSEKGAVQREGLGFVVEGGAVLTAFQVIDGAGRLRITPASGVAVETDQVSAVQRWEDWAVLKPALPAAQEFFTRAVTGAWSVGEHCLTLNTNEAGALTIVDAQITGIQKVPNAGERISVSIQLDRKAIGAPLFNEFGEVVGLIGGVPFPGALSPLEFTFAFAQQRYSPYPSAAIPISKVKPGSEPSSLSQLAADGTLMPAVVPVINTARSAIAKKIEYKTSYPDAQDERFVYKKTENQVTALVIWHPQKKLKASVSFRLFNLNNRLIAESKPGKKISFDPSAPFVASTWPIALSSLPNDTYRVDVRIDDETAWRGFFRVTD